ncbi:MAG: hypothetical protein IH986_12415, partial [Planctomycetes bacterium]|nr:hypothetical protein [Planctomycetota bacterium]
MAIADIKQEIQDRARALNRILRVYEFKYEREADWSVTLTLNVQGESAATRRIETLDQLAAVKGTDYE